MYPLVTAYLKHSKLKKISTGYLDLADLSCLPSKNFSPP